MEISIMSSRYQGIEQAIAGYAKTGIALLGWDGQKYRSVSTGDDLGVYYFVPKVAALLHGDAHHSINLFFVGMMLAGLAFGLLGSALLFKTWPGRLVALVGMTLLARLALHIGDVYITSAAIVLATVPFFLYFAKQNKFSPLFGVFLFLAGTEISVANWIRSQSGYGPLLLMLIVIAFGLKIAPRQRAALLACLLIGLPGPILAFKSIQNRSEAYLAANQPGYQPLLQKHVLWHAIYLGLGFLDNPYGIQWSDKIAADKVASIDPTVLYCSTEYEQILKREVIRFFRANKFFVLKTVAAKGGVLILYLLFAANIGLLAALRFPKDRTLESAFWLAMGVNALSGLLVMPEISYVMSYIALAVVYGVVSINTALESGRLPYFGKGQGRAEQENAALSPALPSL